MRRPWVLLLVLAACNDNLPAPSFIDKLRVLGIQAQPATVAPSQPSQLQTLTVDATSRSYLWLVCRTDPGATTTMPCGFGSLDGSALPPSCGATQDGTLCTLGTDATETIRPTVDVLVTYVVGDDGDATSCYLGTLANDGLPTEPDHCVISYKRVTVSTTATNENPTLDTFELVDGDTTVALDGEAIATSPKSRKLRVMRGEGSAELVDGAYEALSLSWFTDGGSIDGGRSTFDPTGCTSQSACATEAPITIATTDWKAPLPLATVHLWAVLRDDRGGIGWRDGTLSVR